MLYKGEWFGVEPHERPYFKGLRDANLLAWSDEEAWERYPEQRWVYEKDRLYSFLGQEFTTDASAVSSLDWDQVVRKPRINLRGMGEGAHSYDMYAQPGGGDTCSKGVLYQPYYGLPHLSTDVVVRRGRVIDYWTFRATPVEPEVPGVFDLWTSVATECPALPAIQRLLQREEFRQWTGVLNVETRSWNDRVLEIHLRPSVQFFDVSGGLLGQLPALVKEGRWTRLKWKQTYSVPFFLPCDVALPTKEPSLFLPSGVSSVQWDRSDAQPEGFRRVLVLNGTDLQQCLTLGRALLP